MSSEVLQDVQDQLSTLDIPSGCDIQYAGEKQEEQESVEFLSKAFLIAMMLVVLVLVIQFNSIMVPLIIMILIAKSLVALLT